MVASRPPLVVPSGVDDGPRTPCWLQSIAEANRLNKDAQLQRGDMEVLRSLLLRLGHANSSVRLQAARCLSTVALRGDERVLAMLLNLNGGSDKRGADDSDTDVRVAAIESAGMIAEGTGNSRVCGRLLTFLEERDWSLRQSAVKALIRVGPKGDSAVLEKLCDLMSSSKWWVKVMSAEALGMMCESADEKVLDALVAALEDKDWAVRKTATQALGRISLHRTPEIKVALTRLVSDSDWRVRKTALESVANVYSPGDTALLDAILSRLVDADFVRSPSFLDVSAQGDADVKTAAILCLVQVARYREQPVITALRGLYDAITDSSVKVRVEEAMNAGEVA